ncbi:MAG: sigma-70 family RNA polymerase sigma factor [Bacteroidales bacterium]|nr:sigma-70 family RNA polymerase sigma factor [Bacteroidales bacterium]MBQ9888121.1 sigma-70 family RNA polymerase sigma factor [Bacteroidales bacterium]
MEKTGLKPIDELVELASAGNGLAFTALWDRHIDQLRAYINSYFKGLSSPDVDDICSRSFEKAFRQIQNFDTSKGLFSTWLKTIARNTALDLLQSEARIHPRNQYVSLDGQTRAASEANGIPTIDNPLDSIIKDEDKQKKETYIEALPELYREIARRRIIFGMSYKDIADEMDLELNTVRTRIRRAKALIEKIREDNEEDV